MTRDLRPSALLLVALALAFALVGAACGSQSADSVAGSVVDSTDEPDPTTVVEPADEGAINSDGQASTPVDLFIDGALVDEIVTVDCTLSSGTATSCYQITVAGYPADSDVGPFCPTTTTDTADEVGIWFDGEQLYDLDGQFILDLPEIYGDDNWHLHDDGEVHVTDTPEAFDGAARPDVAEEYQNHCVEGQIAWLDGGEPITSTVQIPVTPIVGDSPSPVGAQIGVTLSGVTIDGPAPVDAILGAYTIAAFDDCGGHLNPVAGYHLHGATGCSEVGEEVDGETRAFGIALDGFAIHSPLAEADLAAAGLDECNGHTTDELGYHYHANSPELNAVLTCLVGESISTRRGR